MDILIIKTSSLGDVVHALPAVNSLVSAYPDAKIDFLVNPAFREVASYCRNLNELILFDRKKFGSFPGGFSYTVSLIRQLRRKHYDLVIDLQGLLRSAIFAGFADAARKIGFASPREFPARWFYNERVKVAPGHAIERNLELIRHITGQKESEFPPLPEHPEFAARAREILARNGLDPAQTPLVAVAPGARWPSKCFPAAFFASVVAKTAARNPDARFVVLGAPSEKTAAETICAAAAGRCTNLTGGTSIGEMAEILRSCRVLACNDSGPMHIAAALQISVLAFFGPTDPRRTGPYGKTCRVLKRDDLACEPCLKRICPVNPDCPPCRELDTDKAAEEVVRCL